MNERFPLDGWCQTKMHLICQITLTNEANPTSMLPKDLHPHSVLLYINRNIEKYLMNERSSFNGWCQTKIHLICPITLTNKAYPKNMLPKGFHLHSLSLHIDLFGKNFDKRKIFLQRSISNKNTSNLLNYFNQRSLSKKYMLPKDFHPHTLSLHIDLFRKNFDERKIFLQRLISNKNTSNLPIYFYYIETYPKKYASKGFSSALTFTSYRPVWKKTLMNERFFFNGRYQTKIHLIFAHLLLLYWSLSKKYVCKGFSSALSFSSYQPIREKLWWMKDFPSTIDMKQKKTFNLPNHFPKRS